MKNGKLRCFSLFLFVLLALPGDFHAKSSLHQFHKTPTATVTIDPDPPETIIGIHWEQDVSVFGRVMAVDPNRASANRHLQSNCKSLEAVNLEKFLDLQKAKQEPLKWTPQ